MLKVTLDGADDMAALLENIAPRQAINIMRATIHSVAGTIRDDAKRKMPRDEGNMIKATKARREKTRGNLALSTVRVGRQSPDAYYWRFLEYGDGPDGVDHAFFAKAVNLYRQDQTAIMVREFGKKFEAALARARKRQAV
jgi:HK97 gp10 family phage protein